MNGSYEELLRRAIIESSPAASEELLAVGERFENETRLRC